MVCPNSNFVGVPANPRRVLVIDDDPVALKTMTRLLTLSDYDVLCANDLARATNQLVWQPDFVLLDLLLPDGNGADFLSRIRRRDSAALVAILSASWDQSLAKAMRLSPDAVFRKPVDLIAMLEWMKNPRQFVFRSPASPLHHPIHEYCI